MSRLERVSAEIHDQGLAALLVTTPANTYYLSGFWAVTYSRPVIVVVSPSPALIVPELEEAHARERSRIADIRTYADRGFGGIAGRTALHLALALALETLRESGVTGKVGFESDSLPAEGFYTLRGRLGASVAPTRGLVEGYRVVKDDDELALIRRACALADHGMAVEVRATTAGASEIAIMAEGNAAMLREGASRFPQHTLDAASRPISGPKTALPHSMPDGRRIAAGDVVIHGAGCVVDGYHSEVERTVFAERAAEPYRRMLEIVRRAQEAAITAVRPGVACLEVDRAARVVIEEAGYGPQFTHRTGHGLGIDAHELPFLGPGDDTALAPGMVLSVEPGIYLEGVGGFRHSDTILVTDDGCEMLTAYPRDVESLVVKS
jgi:Xaa-Pro dipeptidase